MEGLMAQAIPAVLMAAGAAVSAGGSIIGANSEAKELRKQAAQLEAQAGSDRASSQRAAAEERRRGRYTSSRALALAAASGGGADDPSIINNLADIEGEAEYRALTAMYEGETEAQGKEAQAKANRRGARATKKAGFLKAAGTILSAGSSIADRV
jgi:hypothetical protein